MSQPHQSEEATMKTVGGETASRGDLTEPSLTAESRAEKRARRRPTDEEYKIEALRIRLSYAPRVVACMKCGWPNVEGYCCNTCGDTNPREPAGA
jgi:hypothetical protein